MSTSVDNREKQKTWYRDEMNRLLSTVKSAQGNRTGSTDFITFKQGGWQAKFFIDNGKEIVWHTITGYPSRLETIIRAMATINAATHGSAQAVQNV